ncbi:hypothetical protein TNCV_2929511 [Trichonephila clavipes]|nr:hypothetical protein TNCV_2929511 [Trichonephila clavipes]
MLEAGQFQSNICGGFNLPPTPASYSTSRDYLRIPGPLRESLVKVHESQWPEEIAFCVHYSNNFSERAATASQLSRELYTTTGIRFSTMSVSRRLHTRER